MDLQQLDLADLVQAQQRSLLRSSTSTTATVGPTLSELAQANVDHFQAYADKRARLAENDVTSFFTPAWNSQLENSLLWIAGCRPSIFVRMLYALCGSHSESTCHALLSDAAPPPSCTTTAGTSLGELSWGQMNVINELHMRTVREEEKLTSQLASLQEDVADNPICRVVAAATAAGGRPRGGREVDRALEGYDRGMVRLLKEADKLRMNTLKEIIGVLTPIQAVDFLATGKSLHLTLHEWGKHKDQADEGGGSSSTAAGAC
ncbi:unnamed protein product [Linum tenue]|uniref:DOG1 domain-containing protein n=2 Tax=Linum tenue TaxID=586396 RepID=A0AAV0PXX5_9ROSI|nr:unnamed protein product [Linum tenue]